MKSLSNSLIRRSNSNTTDSSFHGGSPSLKKSLRGHTNNHKRNSTTAKLAAAAAGDDENFGNNSNNNTGSIISTLTTGSATKEAEKFAALAEEVLKNEAMIINTNNKGDVEESSDKKKKKKPKGRGGGGYYSPQNTNNIRVPFVGRERELDELNEHLDSLFDHNISHSEKENEEEKKQEEATSPSVICIAGPGGTGKSFLVQQLKSNVLDRDGYFIRGKFVASGAAAYSGLAMAIQDLVEQILTRDFDMGIRRRLEETFSIQDAAILVEIFPCLSSVLAVDQFDEASNSNNNNPGSSKSFNFSGAFSACSSTKNNSNRPSVAGANANATTQQPSNKSKTQKAKQRQFLFTKFLQVLISSNQTYVDEDIVRGDDRNSACVPQEFGNEAQYTEPPTPLVLVLDDVQWIDPPSMELISAVIKNQQQQRRHQKKEKPRQRQHFLLLCTSRPNQKDNSDNLFGKEIQKWDRGIASTQHVQLGNLSTDDIHTVLVSFLGITSSPQEQDTSYSSSDLDPDPMGGSSTSVTAAIRTSTNSIATVTPRSSAGSVNTFRSSGTSINTLKSSTNSISPYDILRTSTNNNTNNSGDTLLLADIIQEKTQGNAFFVVEFIKTLIDQELLFFNYGSLSWKWDIRKVQSLSTASSEDTNNSAVVNLLTTKLYQQLTPFQQFVLIVASCLGGSFDQGLMERILDQITGFGEWDDAADCLEFFMDNNPIQEQKEKAKEKKSTKATTTTPDTNATLQDLVDLGFLTCSNSTGGSQIYFFTHDLIKQAVGEMMASSMSEAKSHLLRYRIGECILQNVTSRTSRTSKKMEQPKEDDDIFSFWDTSNNSSELFLGTDLLDASIDHVMSGVDDDDEERATLTTDRIQLATYNLFAGEAAMSESAFAAGLRYMEAGLQLLEEEERKVKEKQKQKLQHEHLLTNLLAGAAEAHYCTGSYTAVGTYANRILEKENCSKEMKLKMLYLKNQSAFSEMKFPQCLEGALVAIRLVGAVRFPSNPNKLHLLYEFLKTRRLLLNHTMESLQALPLMDPVAQEKRMATMQILDGVDAASYFSNKNFFMVGAMMTLRWTVKYGVSRFSPNALAMYGIIVLALFGDIKASAMYGEAAIAMAERIGLPDTKAQVSILVFPMIHHWLNDIGTCIPPLAYGRRLAMECGDNDTALKSLWFMDKINWGSARIPLTVLLGDLKQHCATCREYKFVGMHDAMLFLAQQVQRLCSNGPEFAWLNETSEELPKVNQPRFLDADSDLSVTNFIAFVYLQVHFLLGEQDEALKWAEQITAKGAIKHTVGQTYLPNILFYRALAFLILANQGKNTRRNLGEVKSILKVMRSWRSKGGVNIQHMICLLEAEVARLQSKNDIAKDLYSEAIQTAIRFGHIHDAGICNECAAVFYLGIEEGQRAAHHIQQAVKCFRDWGATAVVERILKAHGDLIPNSTFAASFHTQKIPTLVQK